MINSIKLIIKFEMFEKFFLFFFHTKIWNLKKLLIKISLYWVVYIIDCLKKNILSMQQKSPIFVQWFDNERNLLDENC